MKTVVQYTLCLIVLSCLAACGDYFVSKKQVMQTSSPQKIDMRIEEDMMFDIDHLLVFLKNKGFSYDNEMKIAGLSSGFLEGRKVTNDGIEYTIYRVNTADEALRDAIEETKKTKTWRMKVFGVMKDFPAYHFRNYLFVGPEGEEFHVLRQYFEP